MVQFLAHLYKLGQQSHAEHVRGAWAERKTERSGAWSGRAENYGARTERGAGWI